MWLQMLKTFSKKSLCLIVKKESLFQTLLSILFLSIIQKISKQILSFTTNLKRKDRISKTKSLTKIMVWKMICNQKMSQEQLYSRKKESVMSTNIWKGNLKKSNFKLTEFTIWDNALTNFLIITPLIWVLLKD